MSAAADNPAPVLQIEDLCVERSGQPVLAGVSLSLHPGQCLSVEGAVGSGKTTLLWAILGLLEIQRGRLEIFGKHCRAEKDFALFRGRVGLLFQDPEEQLIGPSVLEDVQFGLLNLGADHNESQRRAQRSLAEFGIEHLAHRSVRSLSGGQQRLVALAGVISMQPDLLLLDEPTAALDADTSALILKTLSGLQRPMLLVSHDPHCIATLATHRCRLQDGRLWP